MDLAINNNNRFLRVGAELALVGALTLAAFLVRLAIDPFVGDKHQFVPAYAAVAAATWLAGWRAGALTAFACLLTGEAFAPQSPVDSAAWHVAVAYAGYLGMSLLIVSLAEWVRRDKEEAALAAAEMLAADRRRSDFMALLGHELRSPLATIALGERMIKSGHLDAMALRGTAEMMERQTERMTRLVADLLDVARLQTGKLSLRPVTLDVSLLVQEAAEEVRAAAGARDQRLVLLHPAAGGFMFADPLRLHQVLVNLLQNACKFSPEHSEVELSVSGDEGWVTISVKDQGIGIAPSQLERIFEPFVQLPGGHGEDHGLGLGLPLTRELVRMHGGSIRAFSAGAGRGSEFVVKLPRGAPPGTLAASLGAGEHAPGVSDTAAGQAPPAARRIMVVEDNPDAAATLALLLQLKGHEAFTAADGKGALEAAAQQRPELVFLDVGLPDMNGLEVATRLRELLGARATLVALTGWGGDEDRRRSRAAGCDAHLTKPVDPEALDAALALVHEAREPGPAPVPRRPAADVIVGGVSP
jgi:signal transduction histidine kinase/ActR/RegA family two-component response regulator